VESPLAVERKKVHRIGILTGGGDCPGLNAVIRAIVKPAILKLGLEVVGVEDGFLGLIRNRMHPLTLESVSGIVAEGGTILGTTNKADPRRFAIRRDAEGKPVFEDVTPRVIEHIRERHIDVVVCIGGEGTMAGALPLAQAGIACIGVPKTIDNDLMHTDITFGFSTAVQTATECLDKIRTTGSSHHRVMLVELMGRNAGWLTIHAGLAAGVDVILIPEVPYRLDAVCEVCRERSKRGKRYTIIAVSEGAHAVDGEQVVQERIDDSPYQIRLGGVAILLARQIQERTGLETRPTILGHVQRGGSPIAFDRVLATQFGHMAIQLVATYDWNQMVVMQGGRLGMVPLESVAGIQRQIELDDPIIATARALGVCMGD
jgi:6-phosphofructokinase 1